MSVAEEPVTVSAARLKELEELESRLDSMLESARSQAVNEYRLYINSLSRDTKTRAKKQLEKYYTKREEINARRRAAYAAKKAAESTKN